jgi:CDP-glucose 4,6-dehydratase
LKKYKISKFWKNKKILIVGHTGFKGSWLTILLHYLGAKVYGYSLKPEKNNFIFKKLHLNNLLEINCFGDINSKKLKIFIKNVKPQIVINLAAQPLVRKSYTKPIKTYETNLMGAIKLLYACRNISSIKSILMITTDKVYKNNEKNVSYKETDELGGFDPYSSSKAASEIAINSFQKSYFNKKNQAFIAIARAGNIIGGGDWSEDRLLPDIIKSYYNKKKLIIRFPNAIRPWQHVLEPLYGYLILCENLYKKKTNTIGAWNFGPDNKKIFTVRELIKEINLYKNLKIKIKINRKNRLHENKILKLDNNKAKNKLNWKPVLSSKEMISLTIDWYLSMKNNKKNLYALTIEQINYFINKI